MKRVFEKSNETNNLTTTEQQNVNGGSTTPSASTSIWEDIGFAFGTAVKRLMNF